MRTTFQFIGSTVAGGAAASIALLAAACTQDASADKLAGLAGTSWTVVGIPTSVKASLSFGADGKLVGHAGCNRFFATYTTSGKEIAVGRIGSTRKLCPPVEMSVERELLKTLSIVNRWSGNANNVELTGPVNRSAIRLERVNNP